MKNPSVLKENDFTRAVLKEHDFTRAVLKGHDSLVPQVLEITRGL